MTTHLGGVILAGGKSQRMGRDKAGLYWQGRTYLEQARCLAQSAGAKQVYVQGRLDDESGIADASPGSGPAQAIISTVDYLQQRGFDAALILAIDMPHLHTQDLKTLIIHGEAGNPTCYDGAWLPMYLPFSAISSASRATVSLRSLASSCGIKVLPPLDRVTFSVNSPGDIAKAERTVTAHNEPSVLFAPNTN